MQRLDLNGKWEFKAVDAYGTLPRDRRAVRRWMPANVPGTVHTDLLAHRKIPDPFHGTNELDVQWVASVQWAYRRKFEVPASILDEDAVHLVAEGLDTYARIHCNGRLVGKTSNMFVGHRLDIREYLRPGRNTIEILFDSPMLRAKALEKKHGPLRVALEPHRVYVRKAQYSFSWDWGPKLTTSGIWRDIAIEGFSQARLQQPFVRVLSVNKSVASIRVSAEIERTADNNRFVLEFSVEGKGSPARTVGFKGSTATMDLRIPRPHLWWPNGYGGQNMYLAVVSLIYEGKVIDRVTVPFAIRTVKLVQEKDGEGKSFIVEVNGRNIFCKGADWIPSDSFIPRISDSTYETLLHLAKNAHMNMIRVWGGGIYEQDIFYNLCDRLGLMVWQDFMFACGEYPGERWFLTQVKEEAEKAVRRLRNHPGIVIWCGNNECEWLFCTENPDKTADDMRGARIFRDVLPDVCRRLDGTRPYWRSSPFGEGFPNDESNGTHHQWNVWSNWRDYKEYANDNARFVAEFGFQAMANLKTMEEISRKEDRHLQSPVMEHHNKQVEGPERLIRFQAAHYRVDDNLDNFIYKSQLVQAEALKHAVEHWRRRMFRTSGALFWQLNDCWPVSSWAVVDSALRPKAAYYYAKKFFAPMLVSFKQTPVGVEVWMTSDLDRRQTVKLSVSVRSFNGGKSSVKTGTVSIPPNASRQVMMVDEATVKNVDPTRQYLHAKVLLDGRVVSENRFFLVEPKHLQLPRPTVTFSVTPVGDSEFKMVLRTGKFVKNVRVEVEGGEVMFSDNYIDIDAGTRVVIRLGSKLKLAEIRKKTHLYWLEKGRG